MKLPSAKETFGLLKAAFRDFNDDDCPRMAAALSYYTVFALPPLLILILLLLGAVFDPQEVETALHTQFRGLMGSAGADEMKTIIAQAESPGTKRGVAAVLGVGTLMLGATGAFLQLQSALNRAWEVEPDRSQGGIRHFILKRVLSLGMVVAIGFLLLVSMVMSAAVSAFGDAIGRIVPGLSEPAGHVITLVFSFAMVTLLFAAIYKVLPDARIAWRDVWVGAVVTALLFVIGKFLIGLYLGRSDPGQAYGAAGSLAVVLVWIYYSAMIVLFGAEFTQTWVVHKGREIEPETGAKLMHDETPVADPSFDAVAAAEAARKRAESR